VLYILLLLFGKCLHNLIECHFDIRVYFCLSCIVFLFIVDLISQAAVLRELRTILAIPTIILAYSNVAIISFCFNFIFWIVSLHWSHTLYNAWCDCQSSSLPIYNYVQMYIHMYVHMFVYIIHYKYTSVVIIGIEFPLPSISFAVSPYLCI